MNKLQLKIIKDTLNFRPSPKYPTYPPYHSGDYLEEYFFNYFVFYQIDLKRYYIPIFWTNLYNNGDKYDLQSYLDSLDQKEKYFIVCQHEEAPIERLPKNTLIFSASGKLHQNSISNNHIPIPLVCSPIPDPVLNRKRDIFCSFVGANTHKFRQQIHNKYKDDTLFHISMDKWSPEVSKPKELEFKNVAERSIFTLCPRGDGPTSFRMYEAMQLGSIPVYVTDLPWLPYEDEVNWNDCCVLISDQQIVSIREILENIPEQKIQNMRRNIKEMYKTTFCLEKMPERIINKIKNEKPKLLTFFSDSHDILFSNFLKPSVKLINEYDLVPCKYDQIGTGSFMENGWKESMLKKLEFISQAIDDYWGENFVFVDADVIFVDKTWNFLNKHLGTNDAAFQKDVDDLCAGVFIMNANEASKSFISTCIKKYSEYPEDQTAMRHNTSLIKYDLLPNEIFNISMVNEGTVWTGQTNLQIPQNILLFHANWSIGIESKIDLFNFVIGALKNKKDLQKLKFEVIKHDTYLFQNNAYFTGCIRNGEMKTGQYFSSPSIPLPLIKKQRMNNKPQVNVYFNYFVSTRKNRQTEINMCLNQLAYNSEIDKIYILCSNKLELQNEKFIKIDINSEQPTFKDFFNIANFNTDENDINIILNSDCFIDAENVKLVKENLVDQKQVYCLSRWNVTKIKPLEAQHYNIECSQDAWIFKGQISEKIQGQYKMGMPGCDNAIAAELFQLKYDITNPSLDVKVYHVHFVDYRTYNEKNRVKRPYKFVTPCKLKEPSQIKVHTVDDKTILEIPSDMTGAELKQFKEEQKQRVINTPVPVSTEHKGMSASTGGIRP